MLKKEGIVILIDLIIYVMIGLAISLYKFRKINQFKAILTIFFWPLILIHSYIELVDKIKYQNRKR